MEWFGLLQKDYSLTGYNWRYAIALWLPVIVWSAVELHGAIVRKATGDTHTEMLRPFIHAHPLIWCATLGVWVGVCFWVTVHLWWGWK